MQFVTSTEEILGEWVAGRISTERRAEFNSDTFNHPELTPLMWRINNGERTQIRVFHLGITQATCLDDRGRQVFVKRTEMRYS